MQLTQFLEVLFPSYEYPSTLHVPLARHKISCFKTIPSISYLFVRLWMDSILLISLCPHLAYCSLKVDWINEWLDRASYLAEWNCSQTNFCVESESVYGNSVQGMWALTQWGCCIDTILSCCLVCLTGEPPWILAAKCGKCLWAMKVEKIQHT